MITIEVAGGLGNQMFQYALYRKYLSMGKAARIDVSSYTSKQSMPFELDLFDLKYEIADKKPQVNSSKLYNAVLKGIRKAKGKSEIRYFEKLDVGYQPEILEFENAYLSGYWQCEKYFCDIRDEIYKAFTFPKPENVECSRLAEQMRNENSTSIHVRRGDYLLPENARKYGNICTLEYYKRAIGYIRSRRPETKFYLFSNDQDWVKENLYENGMTIVSCNKGSDSFFDIYLMSQCRNNIIANSSFSWWGAWLNQNPDKLVISPTRWFSHLEVSDAICDDWIRV